MRKHWTILLLFALLASFTLASQADAQKGGGGGRGVGGGGPGRGPGVGGGWRGGGWYGPGFYGPNYWPNYNYVRPNYGSRPGYYGSNYGWDDYQYRSYYPPTDDSQAGFRMRILVPTEETQVWISGDPTQQRGRVRVFESPPLEPGSYSYTVRARWRENGRDMDESRTIRFHPGDSLTVDFRQPLEELLPRP